MKSWISAHRATSIVGAVVVLGVLAWLVFYFFGFQTALTNREVNEALPTVVPTASVPTEVDPAGEQAASPEG